MSSKTTIVFLYHSFVWFVLMTVSLRASNVVDPTGKLYTGVSANNEYSASFAASNLFSSDVTAVLPGTQVESTGKDWAIVGTGPGYVRFQLDRSHPIDSVFYAQRIGADPNLDKIDKISIWVSTNGPFAPTDPGTAPAATATITNKQSGIWIQYSLSTSVTGRFFLIKVEQNPAVGGNIGGNELRLGTSGPDIDPPVVISISPAAGALVSSLTDVAFTFNEGVAGVDNSDLLVNGQATATLTSATSNEYSFHFSQPANGAVQMAWATNNGIHDLSSNLNAFAGGSWSYTLNTNLPHLMISEFMAVNQSTIQDENGDHSPWIELYNPTTNAIDLTDWSLTDDSNNISLWRFPNVTIEPLAFIVVFASGKDRAISTNELHSNFQLPVSNGFLALADPRGNIISSFNSYPQQQADVSYGSDLVSPNFTGFFTAPTPADLNSIGGTNFSPAVSFSQPGGTFVPSFNLQLSTPSTNAVIRYTLDGSLPMETSTVYSSPFPVTDSIQVRARSFTEGLLPGPLHSENYIKLDPGLFNTNSDLPAIVIYNFGAGSIPQDDKQFASISVYEPQNGKTSLTNGATLSVRAGLNIHGSTTANLPKQSFGIELRDDLDNDEDHPLLGLPAESDWILYAPDNFEPVLIHNPLIYQLSNEIGRYAPRTRFVEVYVNTSGGPLTAANYNGIYVLEEKIKWGEDRVNIDKIHSVDELHPQDNSGVNLTGGYLMKIDRLGDDETGFSAVGQTIAYVDPKEADIKTPQRAPQQQYLQNYMDTFGTVLNGSNYTDPTNGFRAFVDQSSWIDHHILNVMAFNVDALRLSAFFYKGRGDKLFFGPVWDFDRSQGSTDGRDFSPLYWISPSPPPNFGTDYFNYLWWGRMFTDIDFWQAWIDRYQNLRDGILSTNHIYANIDALAAQVASEQPREAARWPSLTQPRSGSVSIYGYSYTFPGTYQGEIDFLKKWYADRLRFMDTNFLTKPVFSDKSGAITPGFNLTITAPAGATIYYTTNNTDPRLPGGGVSSGAVIYTSPIVLTTNATVTARAFDTTHHNLTGTGNPPLSSPWSGVTSELFVQTAAPVITQSPKDMQAYFGQNTLFAVQATGNPTPLYQWQLNGTDLDGATNAQLSLTNLQANQAGIYSITATNIAGGASASFELTITPKPTLVVTEVMSSEAKKATGVTLSTQDWWELSNLGNFGVNLQGYRFDDDHNSFADAETITNAVNIAPGESIVFVNNMTSADFRSWWGPQKFPATLQIIPYPTIGFSSDGDAIHLWNAAAASLSDTVTDVTYGLATKGVSFGYDPAARTFGGLSVVAQNGGFVAAVNGDIGSPGTVITPPLLTNPTYDLGAGLQLKFATVSNLNYRVEYTTNVNDPLWISVTNFTATSSSFNFTAPVQGNVSGFYRVIVAP
ncbi:MAG TPA: CotH kinase family protein [Verrucomicrobiae bacterium]|jgi:hypothetical protein|nr:CotH kinase family protein [Verrucomicrobiae bacterium]